METCSKCGNVLHDGACSLEQWDNERVLEWFSYKTWLDEKAKKKLVEENITGAILTQLHQADYIAEFGMKGRAIFNLVCECCGRGKFYYLR